MGRLILINGAPGSGKSTLAQRFADDNPLTLVLDVDVVRSLLGGWLDSAGEAGLLARELALGMARVHLGGGRDVVVPQYLRRSHFVDDLESTAGAAGVEFVEVVLTSDPADAQRGFLRRSAHPESDRHRDAALVHARAGNPPISADYARMLEMVEARPRTRFVETVDGDIDRTYRDLVAALTR